MWDYPISVEIDGKEYAIRNKCDYRVVLDVICALNDSELEKEEQLQCALFIFYEDLTGCKNVLQAVKEMYRIISYGETESNSNKPRLMDWEHDFKQVVAPVNRVLGYDIRTPGKYTHWWSFMAGFLEMGSECTFANIVSIRSKNAKHKKLDKWEEEYYRENRNLIDLPLQLTPEERELLNAKW